ncbi:MAG TPA: hypothetical protein VM052_00815 [Candidatus Limnocylindrales bacterium]|nr:hypothetical protein [Candidatus Limnocylindrales bacterium]
MIIRAELVIVFAAIGLALIAFSSSLTGRFTSWRTLVAVLGCAMAGLGPALFFPHLVGDNAPRVVLWEWSAVGGPTIQASYRLDGLAAVGVAIAALYGAAALIATTRVLSRSPLLRPALLLNTFILIGLAVTDDLVAATVVLGALVVTTIFVSLLVSPAAAVARVTAYLAAGVQAFVVADLLVTRFGEASFRFDRISPDSISPGVVLAASIGGALFAGLYPFVPWGYRADESGERESLRGLLTMPAGVGASLVLIRVVGATRLDLAQLRLPGALPVPLLALAVIFFAITAWRAYQRRPRSRRRLAVASVLLGAAALYPWIHWSHVVIAAAFLTVAYAAGVSLALPDQWPVTRYDVALAAAWIGIATGAPTAVAGAVVVLLGGAIASLADAFWMPPHRGYIAMLTSTTTVIAGALAILLGALDAQEPVTAVLAVIAISAVIALELIHVGRRLDVASAPTDLEITAVVVAFLSVMLIATSFGPPLVNALGDAFGRPQRYALDAVAYTVGALAVLAALLVVAAGAVRPLLPDTAPVGATLVRFVRIADPVPTAAASFRVLERSATAVSAIFVIFEQRAGVWLALVLITGVLFWAVR